MLIYQKLYEAHSGRFMLKIQNVRQEEVKNLARPHGLRKLGLVDSEVVFP